MKYGVLGDIHGNLSALETVLGCMDQERVDRLISVGDVVGYGAAPREEAPVVDSAARGPLQRFVGGLLGRG